MMCVCCILIKITYIFTYLLTYLLTYMVLCNKITDAVLAAYETAISVRCSYYLSRRLFVHISH